MLAQDDAQARSMRLLLLRKGVALAHRFYRPLAAPSDDEQARGLRLLLLGQGAVFAHRLERSLTAEMNDDQRSLRGARRHRDARLR
jgi:hypothetical protein